MGEYLKSFSGRLMALSIGIALVGGAASVLMSHGTEAGFVMSLALFLPIVINVVGLPRALEDHWTSAVLAVILLPFALFLWTVGVGVMHEFHPGLAYPFLVAGLASFAIAGWPAHRLSLVPARPVEQH